MATKYIVSYDHDNQVNAYDDFIPAMVEVMNKLESQLLEIQYIKKNRWEGFDICCYYDYDDIRMAHIEVKNA
jgi:hypothetical protein